MVKPAQSSNLLSSYTSRIQKFALRQQEETAFAAWASEALWCKEVRQYTSAIAASVTTWNGKKIPLAQVVALHSLVSETRWKLEQLECSLDKMLDEYNG